MLHYLCLVSYKPSGTSNIQKIKSDSTEPDSMFVSPNTPKTPNNMYSCNIQNMNFALRLQSALRHHLLTLKTRWSVNHCFPLLVLWVLVSAMSFGCWMVYLVSHLHIVLVYRWGDLLARPTARNMGLNQALLWFI